MSIERSFAAYNRNNEIRTNSSSGGVFFTIAQRTITDKGIVFGAAFDENWQVIHKSCDHIDGLKELMQSKYVQSSMVSSFKEIRKWLFEKRPVLFCGTPCQVQGLLSFLKVSMKDDTWRDFLLTIDFICHGVPSRKIWRRYLAELSGQKKVISINFRDKINGWTDYSLRVGFEDGTQYIKKKSRDLYLQGFLQNLILRETCYECHFKGLDRPSDLTIADFWGAPKLFPDIFDDRGTSVIMAHNEKALRLIESLGSDLELHEIDYNTISEINTALLKSAAKNPKRISFFQEVDNNGIIGLLKKYTKKSFISKVNYKVKEYLFWKRKK